MEQKTAKSCLQNQGPRKQGGSVVGENPEYQEKHAEDFGLYSKGKEKGKVKPYQKLWQQMRMYSS